MDAFAQRAARAAAPWKFLFVATISLTATSSAFPARGQGSAKWTPVPAIEKDETLGEAWVKRTEEAFMQRAPGLAPVIRTVTGLAKRPSRSGTRWLPPGCSSWSPG